MAAITNAGTSVLSFELSSTHRSWPCTHQTNTVAIGAGTCSRPPVTSGYMNIKAYTNSCIEFWSSHQDVQTNFRVTFWKLLDPMRLNVLEFDPVAEVLWRWFRGLCRLRDPTSFACFILVMLHLGCARVQLGRWAFVITVRCFCLGACYGSNRQIHTHTYVRMWR